MSPTPSPSLSGTMPQRPSYQSEKFGQPPLLVPGVLNTQPAPGTTATRVMYPTVQSSSQRML